MNKQIHGRIVKGIGGFYYVRPSDSLSLIECRARGIFRHQRIKPVVGDYVEVTEKAGDGPAISKIEERRNVFVRPPVANVDVALITFAAAEPAPNFLLLDKLLVASELHNVAPIICLTKTDLADAKTIEAIMTIYAKTPYPVICLEHANDAGVQQISEQIAGKTAFLAGPSGVGKSTLANALCQSSMQTGDISQKLRRGKHTTRHVELLDLANGGYLLDTPGFSSFKLDDAVEASELQDYFPEFEIGSCKFSSCVHQSEPGCAVKAQLASDQIAKSRYDNYLYLLEELKNRRCF